MERMKIYKLPAGEPVTSRQGLRCSILYLLILTVTLYEDRYMFIITSSSVLLRMRNVSDRKCGENQKTRFLLNNFDA